jgi:hypothetical protein
VTVDEIEIIDVPGVRVRLLSAEHVLLKLPTRVIYQDVTLQVAHDYAVEINLDSTGLYLCTEW